MSKSLNIIITVNKAFCFCIVKVTISLFYSCERNMNNGIVAKAYRGYRDLIGTKSLFSKANKTSPYRSIDQQALQKHNYTSKDSQAKYELSNSWQKSNQPNRKSP